MRPCSGKLFPRSNSSVIPEVRLSSVFCRSQLSALHSYFKYEAMVFLLWIVFYLVMLRSVVLWTYGDKFMGAGECV